MGCALDIQAKKNQIQKPNKGERHGRINTIDTRKKSTKVVDKVIENVTLSKQSLNSNQVKFAAAYLEKLSLFNSFSSEELKMIGNLLIHATAKSGDYIFHQGDVGHCFFIIESGEVDVQIDGTSIKTLSQGQSFGQLALILRTKRSAGIRAKTPCSFLLMKPLLFKETMQKIKSYEYAIKRSSINEVQIFDGLTNKQKLSLSNALKVMVYEKGQRIFSKGEQANAFFIINQGKVVVELKKQNHKQLTKNQYFGEGAFQKNGKRQATVVAVQRTSCSIISKHDFQKYSGTSSQQIYFYMMKKWALLKSPVFKQYPRYILNKINLAFETNQAKQKQKIRNDGLVIRLQGRINNQQEQVIFGQKEFKQKTTNYIQLIQTVSGSYAYLGIKKLMDVFKQIKQKKQSKQINDNPLKDSDANKQNKTNLLKGFIDLSTFEYIKDLGEGQFGAVKLVRDKSLNRLYALKQISKEFIKKQGLEKYIEQERDILQRVEFPFIVGFVKSFTDHKNVYFLMQYIKGVEMFNVIREMPSINKQIAKYFFASLLLAVQHLHQKNIIYRDIKPQNSVVDHTGKVFLIDMGTAKLLAKDKNFRTFTVIGTPHYMSPQVFTAQGYSFESDIWSLGVLMYQFLCNKLPFGQTQEDTFRVMQMIKKDKVKYPKNLDPQAQQLLQMMLNKNSKQRVISSSFEKIKQSSYYNGFDWQQMKRQHLYPPYIPKIFKKLESTNKNQTISGKPLIKQLYPKQYLEGKLIQFKEWNEEIIF